MKILPINTRNKNYNIYIGKNIKKEEFYNFQKNFLLKNKDLELIKLFVEKKY